MCASAPRLVTSPLGLLLGLFVGTVLGLVVGLLAVLVHRGGTTVPWGLALAVASSVAGSVGLGAAGVGRHVLLGYGLGWVGGVLLLTAGRPEGDFLVAGDAIGWSFMGLAAGGVMVSSLLGAALGSRRRSGAGP